MPHDHRMRPLNDNYRSLPRLTSAMMRQANLSQSEAEGAIQMHRRGMGYAGEAVNHYGGVQKVLSDTVKNRNRWSGKPNVTLY